MTTQQKENFINSVSLFLEKDIICNYNFFKEEVISISFNNETPFVFPIDEIENYTKSFYNSLKEINIPKTHKENCFNLLQFFIENEIHFNWQNKKMPEITIWDKSNRKCHIIVGECYTFYSIHQPQKVDFNNLIKIIKQTMKYDKN